MTFTNRKSLIALLIALCVVVSLFTVSVSATETAATGDTAEVVSNEETTVAATEAGSEATTEEVKETTTEAKEETTTTGTDEQANAVVATKKKALIINAIIIAAIVAICVAVAVKFRAKLGAFMRSVKSELGKIVWSGKENTRKSFLVVVVVAVAIAIIIGVLDLAFNTGIGMLGKLFG